MEGAFGKNKTAVASFKFGSFAVQFGAAKAKVNVFFVGHFVRG